MIVRDSYDGRVLAQRVMNRASALLLAAGAFGLSSSTSSSSSAAELVAVRKRHVNGTRSWEA